MIFHYDTVMWFNEWYVTMDIPEAKDLETFLEVGAFSWNWMEPCIGQASFLILCMQFGRNQLINMGIKPYTGALIRYRYKRLLGLYPQYNETVMKHWAITLSWEKRRKPVRPSGGGKENSVDEDSAKEIVKSKSEKIITEVLKKL